MRCVFALSVLIICLARATPPKDDADALQRLVQFGLNARFLNRLKKEKEKHTGMHCGILAFNINIISNFFSLKKSQN